MSGQRRPKKCKFDEMCFQCKCWKNTLLDYGKCKVPNIVGGYIDLGEHYAYEKACFLFSSMSED